MRIIGSIFAAGGFPLLVLVTVFALDDNSIRALSLEIAVAAYFLGGCILLAAAHLANAIMERQGETQVVSVPKGSHAN